MSKEFKPTINPYDLQSSPEHLFVPDPEFLEDLTAATLHYRAFSPPENYEQVVDSSSAFMEYARKQHRDFFSGIEKPDEVAELYATDLMRRVPTFWNHLRPGTKTVVGAMVYIRTETEELRPQAIDDIWESIKQKGLDEYLIYVYSELMETMIEYRLSYPDAINLSEIAETAAALEEPELMRYLTLPRPTNQKELVERMSLAIKIKGEEYKRPGNIKSREFKSTFGLSHHQIAWIVQHDDSGPARTVLEVVREAEQAVGVLAKDVILESPESAVTHISSVIERRGDKPLPSLKDNETFIRIFQISPYAFKYRAGKWGTTRTQLIYNAIENAKGQQIVTSRNYAKCKRPDECVAILREQIIKEGTNYRTPFVGRDRKKFYRIFRISPEQLTRIAKAKRWPYTAAQLRNLAEYKVGIKEKDLCPTKEGAIEHMSAVIRSQGRKYVRPRVRDVHGFRQLFGINPRTLQRRAREGEWGERLLDLVVLAEQQAGIDPKPRDYYRGRKKGWIS